MEKESLDFERIFGRLTEAPIKLNLDPNEYTFNIDRTDGMLRGVFVNIGGTIYVSYASGDGAYQRITTRAKAADLKFVTPVDSGLFK